jgi:hypothetical protein
MIEMYGFIAAFLVQIVFFSVLGPLVVIETLRAQIERFIAERAPPVDPVAITRVVHRLRLFRLLGLATGVIGLLLLIAMVRYMLRPDWTDGPLEAVVPAYFGLQVLPIFMALLTAGLFHDVLKRSLPPQKRKALLEPRGLFDFVPRSAIALALVAYCLHMALLVYIERHPFPGFAGLITNGVMVTVIYVLAAIGISVTLRKMASSPLQGRTERMHAVGLGVRLGVYVCIVSVLNISVNMALILLDEQRWEPTFGSLGLVLIGVLCRGALKEQLRIPAGTGAATSALAR